MVRFPTGGVARTEGVSRSTQALCPGEDEARSDLLAQRVERSAPAEGNTIRPIREGVAACRVFTVTSGRWPLPLATLGYSRLIAVEGVVPRIWSYWTVGSEPSGGASVVVPAVCEDLGHVRLGPVSEPARHVVERETEVGQLVGDGDRDGWRHGTGEQTIALQRP